MQRYDRASAPQPGAQQRQRRRKKRSLPCNHREIDDQRVNIGKRGPKRRHLAEAAIESETDPVDSVRLRGFQTAAREHFDAAGRWRRRNQKQGSLALALPGKHSNHLVPSRFETGRTELLVAMRIWRREMSVFPAILTMTPTEALFPLHGLEAVLLRRPAEPGEDPTEGDDAGVQNDERRLALGGEFQRPPQGHRNENDGLGDEAHAPQ